MNNVANHILEQQERKNELCIVRFHQTTKNCFFNTKIGFKFVKNGANDNFKNLFKIYLFFSLAKKKQFKLPNWMKICFNFQLVPLLFFFI